MVVCAAPARALVRPPAAGPRTWWVPVRRACSAQASSSSRDDMAPDSSTEAMTADDARDILGLPARATFEEVVAAKNRAVSSAGQDTGRLAQIEKAYDALLLMSMRARLEGSVDAKVKFADVPKAKPMRKAQPTTLPGGVAFAPVDSNEALLHAAIFGILTLWTLAQGSQVQPGFPDAAPGLQVGLAVASGVYVQSQRKRGDLGKSAAMTLFGLLLGTALGSGLQAALRVDLVPLGALGSPSCLVGATGILGAWAATSLLKDVKR